MSRDWTCLRAGHVSGLDLSWLVLGPDLSQGRRCLRAGLVSRFRAGDVNGWKCLAAGSVQKFRAGSVSRPEMSQSLGPRVSWPDLVCGRKSLGAISFALFLYLCHKEIFEMKINALKYLQECSLTLEFFGVSSQMHFHLECNTSHKAFNFN